MRRLVSVLVLLAACGGPAGEPSTTVMLVPTTAQVESTTASTTAISETTTTARPTEPLVLVPSNPVTRQRIAADRSYTYDLNLVPVEFRFSEPGWEWVSVGNRSIWLSHLDEPLTAFFSFRVGETADQLLDEIRSLGPDVANLEAVPAVVADVDGVVLELPVGPPEADGPLPWLDSSWACGGYPLVEERILDARVTTIINPCSVNRLWVLEFDEVSVLLNVLDYSGTKESARTLEELEPLIDELLAAISFGDAR